MPDAHIAAKSERPYLSRAILSPEKYSRVAVAVFGLCLAALCAPGSDLSASAGEPDGTNVLKVLELRQIASQNSQSIESFVTEATVCAANPEGNLLVIEDDSAGVVLEVPGLSESIRTGDRVRVIGKHCALTRARFGLQLGTGPVVKNDGHHGAITKSGRVFLQAGKQPIRVTWFNGGNLSELKVEYEGPGVARQGIPNAALWHKSEKTNVPARFAPGLEFAAYTGDWESRLPDFAALSPVDRGVATNFDQRYSVRRENAGLVFSGYLEVATSGIYTFSVTSDDGAYLYAGEPGSSSEIVVLDHGDPPVAQPFQKAVAGLQSNRWTEVEGETIFAGKQEHTVELELAAKGGERIQAMILNGASISCPGLLHRRARVTGILEALPDAEHRLNARLIAPGASEVIITEAPPEVSSSGSSNESNLKSVERIRHLTPAEAGRGLLVTIRGVVVWSSFEACVLNDGTGGVYVHLTGGEWAEQPAVGQLWKITGTTDPGGFSPVIKAQRAEFLGIGTMPEPIRPAGEQLLNGSLDAEYVELRGVLTEISDERLTLLTAEGKVSISHKYDWPLPRLPEPERAEGALLGSILRMRGCLMARVYSHSEGEVSLHMSPATIEIEELAPLEPFALPTKSMADLQRFDAGAGVLQRTKIRGQIVFGREGIYCLQDQESGCRVLTKGTEGGTLEPGEVVEVVGFPRLGGPSPLLQEAQFKPLGHSPLPKPRRLSTSELLERRHDATLVRVEAIFLEERSERDQRVLQLRAGANQFAARIATNSPSPRKLEVGSRLELTGVYFSLSGEETGRSLDAFQLWLIGPGSIQVLEAPPWWTLGRALAIATGLGTVLCLALVWITVLRRKVEERTAQLREQIEQRQLVEQRRLMEQERTRVAQDLHDELGAGLTEVGLLGDLARNPALPAIEKQQYLGQLTDIARSLVASLDEIVWAVNPHYDSVASLASYCTLFAQRFLSLADIACRPQIPQSFPEYTLDSTKRHGLFLAFREALNNVVRHSRASEVRLRIDIVADELLILVSDNGCGFETVPRKPGADGLAGLHRRMALLGGRCEIRSAPGDAEVVLRLPLERS